MNHEDGAQQQAPGKIPVNYENRCPHCGNIPWTPGQWMEHDAAIAAQARKAGYSEGAAAERERIFGELIAFCRAFRATKRLLCILEKMESMRSEVKK